METIKFSLSIAEQRVVSFIPAWILAILQLEDVVLHVPEHVRVNTIE